MTPVAPHLNRALAPAAVTTSSALRPPQRPSGTASPEFRQSVPATRTASTTSPLDTNVIVSLTAPGLGTNTASAWEADPRDPVAAAPRPHARGRDGTGSSSR